MLTIDMLILGTGSSTSSGIGQYLLTYVRDLAPGPSCNTL